ncbi:hypothetical protein FP2506_02385 [Fulvimarina pelagi HTCC2506]|uniref:Gamma-butyrobetaine hydroxylase-like N-terminal domain-containing protein n=2 Tax=Fulvimarina pelagi TaxID=217511 RepID=Q0FYE3_9HYPH|nr:DUF971 domain-containing protein [Fulvimarina pelagi]EAU40052.1 hypothetical protein FP2506_02385 [Fulvimarina pelagi HTCC2506]BAT31092.1 hypothetical protein [Fulvimarina pelagi]
MIARQTPPSEIRVSKDKRTMTLAWPGREPEELSAEYLRVHSPSAEVQGHRASERKTQFGKRDVEIRKIQPVGNYAIKISFSDGHDTGLYSWTYLSELAAEKDEKWAAYIHELEEKGLPR